MSTDTSELEDLSATLDYAAGQGAANIAASVAESGKLNATTGIDMTLPGPALASILARFSGHRSTAVGTVQSGQVARIADNAATRAGDQGVALLERDR